MNTLESNKVVAAGLTAGIAFFLSGFIGDLLVRERPLRESAIKIETAVKPETQAPQAEPPIAVLLASADPQKGQALTQSAGCVACHSFTEGGKNGIGPNLYNVVGAPHGHVADFAYSAALKAKAGNWTYEALNEWLTKPSAYAPGTKMTFAGLPDPKKRADIIDYLHTLSASPVPFPAAAATAPVSSGGVPETVAALMASADPARGKADTAKLGCVACHSFNEGGRAGVGPNLYGVFGAPHGHMAGFAYSAALKAKNGVWTIDELDQWLAKPAAYAPGTKMTFAGIPDAKTRADVIDYLTTLSPAGGAGTAAAPAPAAAAPSTPPADAATPAPTDAPAK